MPTRTPARYDIAILQGVSWDYPLRVLGAGVLIDTTDYDARMQVRPSVDEDPVLDLTVANGRMTVGFDPPKWQATTAYALGQQVVPTTLNGFVYEVTVAGTSGGTEPSGGTPWPTTLGNTVVNGTVTFRAESTDAGVTNVRATLVPSDTSSIGDWGLGRYDIEVEDGFGHVTRVVEGQAVLSREVTR
jgi:hypothetical protein